MDLRKYDIYVIEDAFVEYFYGREQMFFQLFKECDESETGIKEILIQQVDYITKSIPTIYIYSHIVQELGKRTDFFIKERSFLLENKRGTAELFIGRKKLSLQSSGYLDTEFIFMDCLKQLDFNFFALDLKNGRFGWLKPLKHQKIAK
ncbi:sporulation inhibitor of replication protein SirA [Fervidibacillus albus]|uniref:Sporulation inhibitor of replication protein SirA n=1 Tax=Fervidibacillus albus TaxID=2980026 RepID=A0A9E8LXE9_9BACI|nr:sporulation inhibitor of replication protein SirA [Fervidibacillus albus]WAA10856.1 sporulation inhibitor of replication protein SirA [Fervidibacillus albus]